MPLGSAELAHLILVLALLLACAHGMGWAFRKLNQPAVVGEIAGGLLLGPTLLGALWPAAKDAIFTGAPSTAVVLGALYHLGLLLLMFCSGLEMRSMFLPDESRTATIITATGVVLPFVAALAVSMVLDPAPHLGPAAHRGAFTLVLAIAIAVTSIPVISRILYDLKLLDTRFARIVLTAAVMEDVLLYVVLAVALGLVGGAHGAVFGLPALLGLHGASMPTFVYHIAATALFFALALALAPRLLKSITPLALVRENNPVALLLLLLFVGTGLGLVLGIAPILAAFVAGIVSARVARHERHGPRAIKAFAFAFPVPIYFALVGARLDLVRNLDLVFFAVFFVVACAIKVAGTAAGATLAGETRRSAVNLAIAMNARGGPGIVLASVALDAGIINESFYTALVLLAITTSCLAGWWLAHYPVQAEAARERAKRAFEKPAPAVTGE